MPQSVPRKNVGHALLSGNIYCGHCGGRIFASTARKNHHPMAPGSDQERIPIYKCYNRTQHKEICDGPTTYRAQKVDEVVAELLNSVFAKARKVNEKDLIMREVRSTTQVNEQQLRQAKADLVKSSRELTRWGDLMLDSIEGKCVFTPEQVKERMDAVQKNIDELRQKVQALQVEVTETSTTAEEIRAEHQKLLSWADIFDTASPEERKMIASYMIKAVTLTRDYGIKIELNISEAQYLNGMEM
jgi:site-specific DNA recombinase